MKNTLFAALVLAFCATAAQAQEYFVKEVVFPADADSVTKIDLTSRVVPSAEQLAWQQMGLSAFLHFGMNTFTGREWGDGREIPSRFCPTDLDVDQWVRTLRDAGFKMAILTAKHHDGFCLWPTATTAHSVKSSAWKGGQGDVVKDLADACHKYGLKLGIYLSPWDRNATCYGDSEKYNDMFVAQLTELLSNYGRVDEVWFDGACGEGPNGKKQVYDWNRFRSTIKRLQPDAVMAIMGDDVRWVGNENGTGRVTEWSVTPIMPGSLPGASEHNAALGLRELSQDLGSRALLARASSARWWPSEVDVSIRPGWFFNPKEEAKSLRQLADIYLNSVGRNSVLLLNIPPDKQGHISAPDSVRLMELRRWIDQNFTTNLVKEPSAEPLTYLIDAPAGVNCVVLGEDISRGQQVERFSIEALSPDGTAWNPVARGTTIGYKRILHFPTVNTTALRLNITEQRRPATISTFSAYDITLPPDANDSRPTPLYPRENYKVAAIDADTVAVEAMAPAFDGNPATVWSVDTPRPTHSFTVDMGAPVDVEGFIYTPRTDGSTLGSVFKYAFELSPDGTNWRQYAGGEFSNIVNNPMPQRIFLPRPVNARYFRFRSNAEVEARPVMSVAEFDIITSPLQ